MLNKFVTILCTTHEPNDVRVFKKQALSLAKAGFIVTLVSHSNGKNSCCGVNFVSLGKRPNRFRRMTWSVFRCCMLGLLIKTDIYVFHSVEALPIAIIYRLLGRVVVFDVHEDFQTLVHDKPYIPNLLTTIIGLGVRFMENIANKFIVITIAEKYYKIKYPNYNLELLNYPIHDNFDSCPRRNSNKPKLILYTGNVSVGRGALIHSKIVRICHAIEVHLVGYCPPALASECRKAAGKNSNLLFIVGEDQYLDHSEIQQYYRRDDIIAGVAIFPYSEDIVNKELTKLFEYMAAGLPIICSNFPIWISLVVENGVGIAIDPNDDQAICDAINFLQANPEIRQKMADRGRHLISTKYNWGFEESKMVEMYINLMGKR